MQPQITIITGRPCVGKTSLANKLFPDIMESMAKDPIAIRDTIINDDTKKTILFDALAVNDVISVIQTYQGYHDLKNPVVITTQATRSEIERCYNYRPLPLKAYITWVEITDTDEITPPKKQNINHALILAELAIIQNRTQEIINYLKSH